MKLLTASLTLLLFSAPALAQDNPPIIRHGCQTAHGQELGIRFNVNCAQEHHVLKPAVKKPVRKIRKYKGKRRQA